MEDKPKEMSIEDVDKMLNDALPEHIRNVMDEECERLRQKVKARQYYEKNKDKFKLIEPGTPEWETIEMFLEKFKKRNLNRLTR